MGSSRPAPTWEQRWGPWCCQPVYLLQYKRRSFLGAGATWAPWEGWELQPLVRQASQVPQAGRLFDFKPLDWALSTGAELPILEALRCLGMVCTGTCLGHRGAPSPTLLVFQKQGGGHPRKGTSHRGARSERGAAAVAGATWEPWHERGWEMLEMLLVKTKGRRRCFLGSRGSCTEFLQPQKPLKIKCRTGQEKGWGLRGDGRREDFQALHEPGVLSLGESCRVAHSQALAGGRSITIHVSIHTWYFQTPGWNAPFPPHTAQSLHCMKNSTETTAFSIKLLNQVNFVIPPGLELLKKAHWKSVRCKDVAWLNLSNIPKWYYRMLQFWWQVSLVTAFLRVFHLVFPLCCGFLYYLMIMWCPFMKHLSLAFN